MSDDLVERLRDVAEATGPNEARRIALEAADRIEALTAERDALAEKLEKAVGVTTAALDEIDALNTLPPDENGHQWRESDLLDQEVMHLRATLAQITGETDD